MDHQISWEKNFLPDSCSIFNKSCKDYHLSWFQDFLGIGCLDFLTNGFVLWSMYPTLNVKNFNLKCFWQVYNDDIIKGVDWIIWMEPGIESTFSFWFFHYVFHGHVIQNLLMHRHFLTFGKKSVQQASIARKMSKTSCFLVASLCSTKIELLSETKDLNKSTLFDHIWHHRQRIFVLQFFN